MATSSTICLIGLKQKTQIWSRNVQIINRGQKFIQNVQERQFVGTKTLEALHIIAKGLVPLYAAIFCHSTVIDCSRLPQLFFDANIGQRLLAADMDCSGLYTKGHERARVFLGDNE